MATTRRVAPFWNALYEFNADLILNGHDHNYERFAPQTPGAVADPVRGIREFVVGTGGTELRGIRHDPGEQPGPRLRYGVLKLTLKAAGYDFEFVPIAGRDVHRQRQRHLPLRGSTSARQQRDDRIAHAHAARRHDVADDAERQRLGRLDVAAVAREHAERVEVALGRGRIAAS